MSDVNDPNGVEYQRLKLEKSRFRYDVLKWGMVVIGAITSFYVIDLGKLKLEEFRSRAENQRALLQSYLTATESVQPTFGNESCEFFKVSPATKVSVCGQKKNWKTLSFLRSAMPCTAKP
jgi:hypothetical protein